MNVASSPSYSAAKPSPPIGFSDHIRTQFENLHRQVDLVPELTCFREGGALSSIRYMAHPHGLHVARWLKVLAHTQTQVIVETANPVPAFSNEFVSARPLVPGFLKIPMPLRYFLGGILARFRRSTGLVHAHCASGNGFMAWLSGHPYIIVTYGSEIFEAKQRGSGYRWLLNKILHGAERIADCSPECTRVLREQFKIPAERIYSFHLGYDETNFRPLDGAKRSQLRRDADLPVDEPVWVVNRRTHPLYRTQEVVEGFLEFCQSNPRGRLVLLCGDHQPRYTDAICGRIQSNSQGHRIRVVKKMLSPGEFAAWVQLSDFSISVPGTDNFSIAILESMGCGTVPILSDLDGYKELRTCRPIRWLSRFEPRDVSAMFAETSKSWPEHHDAERNECFRFVQAGFSTAKAIRDITAFSLGTPIQQQGLNRRAA